MADSKANGAKIPITFSLGDRMIDGVTIKPLTFAALAECIVAAQRVMTSTKSFEAHLRRLRMLRQVTYYSGDTIVPLSMEDVLQLPIPAARTIVARLDDNEGVAGKIIRDGDGIDQAITYELGTPIALAGKSPITELEFHARTYGDIEDVMTSDIAIQQTALLISTVAKPLGASLTRLPSWALNMITIADGVTISRDVLPRFLGSPDE